MTWPPWPTVNEKDLARYVLSDTAGRLKLAVNRDDVLHRSERQKVLEAIYAALLKCDIRYAREPYNPSLDEQIIREPEMILQGAGDATCLDLALLFAGICMGNELLPIVVVLDGHALAAVSLSWGRRDDLLPGRADREGSWVKGGLLKDGETLRERVKQGDYLLIECTGFARTETIPPTVPEGEGRIDGFMTFARAKDAGNEQLGPKGRPFVFAIDPAVLQDLQQHAYEPGSKLVIRRPYVVRALPEGFIPRPSITSAMVAALLGDETAALAIHGGGGFGKTTLAAAVCHEPDVVKEFPDGIVWVELGEQDPHLEKNLREIYAAFTDKQPAETTPIGIASEIKNILLNKRWLLVVDDVWNGADLEPFKNLGAHRVMFTTRKRELADKSQIEVKQMSPEESVKLLVAGMAEASDQQTAVEEFAELLHGWALLLELAHARLELARKNLSSFKAALEYVVNLYEQLGVTGFDLSDANNRNQAVVRSLEAGFDAFKEETRKTLQLQAGQLGLFPDATPIPEQVLCELWDRNEFTVKEKTLRPLSDLSIIRWDQQAQLVRLHDSIRAALRTWVSDSSACHRQLLDAWGDPMRLPHEYAWHWYGWHCIKAGQPDRLRKLLLEPAWLQTKLEHTGVSALVADCESLLKAEPLSLNDKTIRLLGDALRKSSYVLFRDRSQLREQLFGRLRPGMSTDLDTLCERLKREPGRPALRERFPNLEPAGSRLMLTLVGTGSSVMGALLLPDGKRALSWSYDGTLCLWNLESGQQIGEPLAGHEESVRGARLLPDGKQALSWSSDGTLRLWNLETGKEIGEPLVVQQGWIEGAWFLPDGKRALSWSTDGALRLWNLETGKEIGEPSAGYDGSVRGALLLPDGKQALSWSSDGTLRLWNLESGKQIGEPMAGHEESVTGALLLPDGKRALSWSSVGTLRLWNLESGKQTGEPLPGQGSVSGALLSRDGKQALSWSYWQTLQLWDLETGKQIGEVLTGHHGHQEVVAGALLLEGKRALSWSEGFYTPDSHDPTLRLWDLETGKQIGEPLIGHDATVLGALLLPTGKEALSWSKDGTLRLWNLNSGVQIGWQHCGHLGSVWGALLVPNGKQALSWSYDGTLRLWDLESGKQIGEPLAGHEESVRGALLLPDGKRALSWSSDGTLRLWDLESGKQIGEPLAGHEKSVTGALLLPDGKRALSWSFDRTLRLWNLETGKEIGEPLAGHQGFVEGALLLPDGKRALSWSDDLRLWHLETGKQIGEPLVVQGGEIQGALLLPGGKRALSWSAFQTLQLWDLESAQQVGSLLAGPKPFILGGVLLLPDGKKAMSWSWSADVRLWDLENCRQIGEPLGRPEENLKGALLLPDGKKALSWYGDGTMRLWDLESGKQIGEPLTGHEGRIGYALPLPDGEHVLSGSYDGTLRLWYLPRSKELGRFYTEGTVTTILDGGEGTLLVGTLIGRIYFLEVRS